MRKLLSLLLLVSSSSFAGFIPTALVPVEVSLGTSTYNSIGRYWVQEFQVENVSTDPTKVVVMFGLSLDPDSYFQSGTPGGWSQVDADPQWDGTYRTRPVPGADELPTTYDIVWDTPHDRNGIHAGETKGGFNVRFSGTTLPEITEYQWFAVIRTVGDSSGGGIDTGGGGGCIGNCTTVPEPSTLLLSLLGVYFVRRFSNI